MKDLPRNEEVELLLSLSCVATPMKVRRRRTKRGADGEFECRTCGRKFPSFQALGGHRTSCDRHPNITGPATSRGWKLKPVVHRCTVCGEAFATGQALGGHMRRHRASSSGDLMSPCELDLNLAPYMAEANGFHAVLLQLFN